MRKKRVWRYYCDFCKKANCSSHSINEHEKNCTKNPNRSCGMCHWAGLTTAPMFELIAAANLGIDTLRRRAHGCPACMLAGIRQSTADCQFDYAIEREQFWATLKAKWDKQTENEILAEIYGA